MLAFPIVERAVPTGGVSARSTAWDCVKGEVERQDRMASLGEIPFIAHEIRQPLTAISTFTSAGLRWLSKDAPNLVEARRALECAAEAAEQASRIIEGIGKLVRRDSLCAEHVLVDDILKDAIEAAGDRADMSTDIVELKIQSPGIRVHCEPTLVSQVLVNLVTNALLAAGERECPIVELSSVLQGDWARIEVADNGPGISPPAAPQLRGGFYSSRPGGMGAGLLFSSSALEAMGGRLVVTGKGRLGGATVVAILPVS